MKKGKLRETQIIAMLNEGEAGVAIADVCRKYQVSSATYYNLKVKYAGMAVSDLQRLKALEDENRKLKQMYADISLEHRILKDIVEKKLPRLRGES